ncbi:MAG TPA: helix-hairpin-helix domain-containing protein [Leptolyngbyaceae cyanobacterium]
MSILRFLFISITTALLVILVSCSQTPNASNNATQSPPAATNTSTATSSSPNPAGKDQININTAILSELDKFEAALGIPALSNKIQANRPYASPEELVSKKVISQEQFDKIKDMVTVEDVVLTGVAKDVDYMSKLSLMKGHLIVAKELLAQQQPKQAEPHIGHPVEEIYVDVEDQLNERNVKEFKTSLISLQDLVKAQPKAAKVNTDFKTSMDAVDSAIAALPENQRTSPPFVLQVINELLDAANSEYGAAIANGKIAAAIEYQDSRGFVNYANQLFQGISQQLAASNPEANKAIASSMSELAKTWPAVIPPAQPVNTPAEVTQLVKTIEQNSQKVINNSNPSA